MDSENSVYLCALSKVFAYKPAIGRKLIEALGGPAAVFQTPRKELAGILRHAGEVIDSIFDPDLLPWARAEAEWARSYGIRLLGPDDPGYPRRLADCDDAPLLLYCKGNADLNAPRALAVVGTRKASWAGRDSCRRIVERLAELEVKPLIVSGLALGIDGVSHLSALDCGLETVGVLPCGLDEIYPRQHRDLARRILGQGALVTDFARGTSPIAYTFLRRNRIIAGMADATLLAESYLKGGGLITASLAGSYNREVFALPGRMSDASFAGCNKLISRQEATLVADEDTIPLALGWDVLRRGPAQRNLLLPGDPPMKREALKILESRSPVTSDELAVLMRIDVSEASVLLLELEMDGRVVADGAKFFLSL